MTGEEAIKFGNMWLETFGDAKDSNTYNFFKISIKALEQQTFKWCTDCKEYDQEKHCCHRWSKVIRDTVEEMKQEPRWISVSERLPEESGMYLVSGRWKNEPYEVWICEFMYLGELKGWANDAKRPIVTAWMPLPKHREVESEQT